MNEVLHLAILVLVALAGFFAVWFRDLISSVISLAALSLLLSIEFYILQAPDVAIAEAAIGAGLSTAIYVLALRAVCKARQPREKGSQQ